MQRASQIQHNFFSGLVKGLFGIILVVPLGMLGLTGFAICARTAPGAQPVYPDHPGLGPGAGLFPVAAGPRQRMGAHPSGTAGDHPGEPAGKHSRRDGYAWSGVSRRLYLSDRRGNPPQRRPAGLGFRPGYVIYRGSRTDGDGFSQGQPATRPVGCWWRCCWPSCWFR